MSTAESSSTRLSLISRIRSDDSRAWQELVQLYTPLVAYWCRRQGIEPSEVDDAVQEIFFTVCRSLESYRPAISGGGFRAWLWTITRNKIIDVHRRSHRQPIGRGGSTAMIAANQIPESLDACDDSQRMEFTKLMHRALKLVESEFEPRTWQAFWRTTVDSQSVAAVAEQLGVQSSTVRQYRFRVLRRLRQQLGETI